MSRSHKSSSHKEKPWQTLLAEAGVSPGSSIWNALAHQLDFASNARQILEMQASRIRTLEHISTTDELTGLANRRSLETFMDMQARRTESHQETGLAGFIDINGFKDINDTLGHKAGDMVLQQLGRKLLSLVRPSDMVARLSGDEFVVVLTRCPERSCKQRMQEIYEALNGLLIPVGQDYICLQVSLGLATYGDGTGIADLIERADKAMYQHKKNNSRSTCTLATATEIPDRAA